MTDFDLKVEGAEVREWLDPVYVAKRAVPVGFLLASTDPTVNPPYPGWPSEKLKKFLASTQWGPSNKWGYIYGQRWKHYYKWRVCRINPREGYPMRCYVGTVGEPVTLKGVVNGVPGPLDVDLGGRLFHAASVEQPHPWVVGWSHPVGASSVQTFIPTRIGHHLVYLRREGGGGWFAHIDTGNPNALPPPEAIPENWSDLVWYTEEII